VLVLPIPSGNTVILFAADPEVLEHAVEWARTIDRPNPTAGGDGLFYYRVRNTAAEEIVATLNGVRSAVATDVRTPTRDTLSSADVPTAGEQPAAPPASLEGGDISGGRLVLDAPRNSIIFQGSSSDWGRVLPLIRQMDQA